ncbi:MAG: methyltransferase domain-containing protein [Candidatus Kerfeldbacteria bacterium]
MTDNTNFYANGLGDQLIDESCYPQSIKDFLRDEEAYLTIISSSFDILVEVGCMHGRYLDWTVKNGKKYIGIDPVKRYITVGKNSVSSLELDPEDYKFILGSAEDLPLLLSDVLSNQSKGRVLLLFPFNCIGNMSDLSAVLKSVHDTGFSYLISTYNTDSYANYCRMEYYQQCGFKMIKMDLKSEGILFTSVDDLHTIAYHINYFQSQCDHVNLGCVPIILSNLLVMYGNFNVSSFIL